MSADNFTGQFISSTFQRLLQLSDNGSYVTDGTGSVVNLLNTTSSHALTASYVPGVTATNPGGGLWSIQFNSASTFQGSNNLTFNSTTNNLTITGSILMSGSLTEAHISTVNWIDFNAGMPAESPTFATGRLHWVDDTKTLGLDTDVNGSVIELGHQQVVRVVNLTGVTIQKGSVVYISGSQGTRPGIATASYTDENDSATTLGFLMHDIVGSGGNTNGYVVTRGMLREVNTSGLDAGVSLYLSSSGQYTSVKPQAPLHDVRLGKVIVGNSTNAGVIYVDIQNGYELDELHDVRIISATNGDLITKSGSLWINTKQLSGSYGLTGSLNIVDGGITGSLFGTASHAEEAVRSTQLGDSSIFYVTINTVGSTLVQSPFSSGNVIQLQNYFNQNIGEVTIDNVANAGFASIANEAYSAQSVQTLNQTVIVSGSVDISGSLFLNGVAVGAGGTETDPVYTAEKPTLATTGSNVFKGDQQITGSVHISGSFGLTSYGTIAPTNPAPQPGLFYFTNTDFYVSLD